jgi:4-hydroxybenzoate polyprenyltransferase
MLMAIFIPHFSLLMGLIGSFTGTMLNDKYIKRNGVPSHCFSL